MRRFQKLGVLTLAGLLGASLLFTSCTGGTTSDDTTPSTGESDISTSPSEQLSYKVTVLNPDGTPASDIIVKVRKNGSEEAFKLVGPTGFATFELTRGDYTVLIESPSGKALHYDTDAAVLTPNAPEITLTVYEAVAQTQSLTAPSRNGDYKQFDAASVGEGEIYVPCNSGDYAYVVFTPTRPGVYEFSYRSELDVELTYHGSPINVMADALGKAENGKLTIEIPAGSVGSTPDTTAQYVFRLNGAGSGCFFTATRTGDVPKAPYDEPWIIPTAPEGALKPYEGVTDGTLTDLDVTNPALTVVPGEDGYYHLQTADGPVVFLRLSSPNPYVSDFKTMCESASLHAYFYNEDGSFDRRERYNELIAEYLTIANEDGVVPLNEQLAYMVKSAGDYMGWWNFSDDLDIFGDALVDPAVAWLFACAVYQ